MDLPEALDAFESFLAQCDDAPSAAADLKRRLDAMAAEKNARTYRSFIKTLLTTTGLGVLSLCIPTSDEELVRDIFSKEDKE